MAARESETSTPLQRGFWTDPSVEQLHRQTLRDARDLDPVVDLKLAGEERVAQKDMRDGITEAILDLQRYTEQLRNTSHYREQAFDRRHYYISDSVVREDPVERALNDALIHDKITEVTTRPATLAWQQAIEAEHRVETFRAAYPQWEQEREGRMAEMLARAQQTALQREPGETPPRTTPERTRDQGWER